jgi:hypothetical protein
MANDLVVNLGARLDQFSRDMDQAGDIADGAVSKIEKSFAGLNPGINLSALAGGGALAALTGLFAALQSINSELADLAKNAEYAGVSIQRFQELRFAATQGGVSSEAASADLRNVAKLLADAKENENSLTKLLDTNNIKYKDRNGEVIKLNQMLTVAGDLIKRFGSMPEKVEAARLLGLSEAWVKALAQGGDAFNKVAAGAQEAGAVIDSQTVAKAAAFDEAWKKSSALLSMQFKAVTSDIAVWLSDLIDKAVDFVAALAKSQGAAGGGGQEKFNATADALAVAAKEAAGLTQDVDQLARVIDNMVAKGGDPDIIRGLRAAREEAQSLATWLNQVHEMEAKKGFPGGVIPLPGARPAGANAPPADPAKLTSRAKGGGDTAVDAYDRETKSLNKKIEVMEAETAAAGTSIENRAAMVEQARLYTAAEDAGIVITEEYAREIEALAGKFGLVTQKAAEAQAKVAAINQAYQTVGSAVSTAFSDAIVEGKKLDEVLNSLVKTLLKASINTTIGAIFKGITPGGSFGFAGGTNYAPGGMAVVGEQGPELVNLPRGSQVIPNDAMGKMGGGGGAIVYSPAIDARGASVEAVARLAQIMEQDRAEFASRTVATIQQARRARVPGV